MNRSGKTNLVFKMSRAELGQKVRNLNTLQSTSFWGQPRRWIRRQRHHYRHMKNPTHEINKFDVYILNDVNYCNTDLIRGSSWVNKKDTDSTHKKWTTQIFLFSTCTYLRLKTKRILTSDMYNLRTTSRSLLKQSSTVFTCQVMPVKSNPWIQFIVCSRLSVQQLTCFNSGPDPVTWFDWAGEYVKHTWNIWSEIWLCFT